MLTVKASYYKLLSYLNCRVSNYDKSLYYAKRSAASYIKSKAIFNSRQLEHCIGHCAEAITADIRPVNANNMAADSVGILASTIFDIGGHTECLMRFAESFYEEYKLQLFLTNSHGSSKVEAKTKYAYLQTILAVNDADDNGASYSEKIRYLINKILASEIKIIFVYMHMDDVVSCAVLSFIAKHTDIKVVFINHGDHTFSLGFEFSDLIIELRRQGQFITQHFRKKLNTTIIPLQGVTSDKCKTYSDEELQAKRGELGLSVDDLVSLSGFSSYKVFKDKRNYYLHFIKNLLQNEPKLKHVLVTELSEKHKKKIRRVFQGNEQLLDRLLVIDRVVEFDLLLQVADVFIDSFPLGSALVHIDAIRNRLPTVIKKNSRNELYTFYNYLYDDYEYAIENVDEMLTKSLSLIRNKDERLRIAEKGYAHYLNTYDFATIKSKYKLLIENSQSLPTFYTPLPAEYSCRIAV